MRPLREEPPADFKIESGIPVPPESFRGKYPFDRMKPGESFAVPLSGKDDRRRISVQTCASSFGRKRKWRFVTRVVQIGSAWAVRVWRLS